MQERSYYNQSFSRGTMCYACQLEVVDELSMKIDWPELSEKRKLMLRSERAARLAKWEATTRVNRTKPSEIGYVYYIRINEHIKIGYAKDVTKRMRHYPPGSVLLAVEPGTMRDEKDRHAQFKPYLVRGNEWFESSPFLERHITALREQYGDPKKLAYEYTKRA